MPQQYKNHIRYYIPHHFIFYPLILVLLVISIGYSFIYSERRMEWICIAVIAFLIGYLAFMLRQHYALGNQNRIVRLEMRLRYFQLTGQRLEEIEFKLSFGQLAALRFASDKELLALLQRTITENLSPTTIKQSIVHWFPDYMRV